MSCLERVTTSQHLPAQPGFLMELFSAEAIFFSFNSVRFQFPFANASQLPATEQDIPLHPGCFFLLWPRASLLFSSQFLCNVRPSSSIHHSSLCRQLPRDLLLTNTNVLYSASIFISVRPSVPAGVCLPVAAASKNAAVNFNPVSEEH